MKMASSNGSALDDIIADRRLFEDYFGIPLDFDESDLDVPSSGSDWSEDEYDSGKFC